MNKVNPLDLILKSMPELMAKIDQHTEQMKNINTLGYVIASLLMALLFAILLRKS